MSSDMVNGKVPYDAAAVTANAEIVEMMSRLPYAAFPLGTEGTKKGEPTPSVWKERAKLDEVAKKMPGEVGKAVAGRTAGNAGAGVERNRTGGPWMEIGGEPASRTGEEG